MANETSKSECGARIRRIRDKLGLMQKDFAKELGISAPTLSDLEAGRSRPGFDILVRLSERFHVNVYHVLFGKGEMFENPLLEFLINIEERDLGVRMADVERFLEYFGKSRQVQYFIMHQFEAKMADDGESILQEVAKKNEIK